MPASHLTLRCSGRGRIECSAAGNPRPAPPEHQRTRVLMRWRAADELGS